jgi:two-component system, cell cycle sensor histidine kinase and response regulator CckA
MSNAQMENLPLDEREATLRVLVVEDSIPDAELQIATLKRAGYIVKYAVAVSEDALRRQLSQSDFDIVLADFNLQNWTGLDALGVLKQSGKEIPVVMVTGSLGDEAAVDCIKEGATDYVLKDRLGRLPLAVRRALAERAVIRERTQAQVALQQSEERYRDLLENANDLIHSYLPDGRILYANRAWKTTLGYTDDEVAKLRVNDVIHPDSQAAWAEQMDQLFRGEHSDKAEIILITRDGRKILGEASRSCKLVDGKPAFIRSIIRDMTERRQLEEQIRQTAKMEAIGQLAGGVAHDFNNLLTVILGYGQILHETVGPHEREYVAEILKSSDRAASLTRQLLAFSRRQIMTPQAIDLNVIVSNMEKMLKRLIGENYELSTSQKASLGKVKADPGQIEQVILNLIVNARDSMPNGGKITLETADVDLDEAYSRTHVTVIPGPYVMLAVSDTGVGMDAATQARIFEPFFTTKELGKGTGLGLSTVYGIVKQSSGNIWVYSEVGRGSTFKVYFPRIEAPVEMVGKPVVNPTTVKGTETVLVVEDEEPVRSLVRVALQSGGYRVMEAGDAQQACNLLEQFRGPIHLVLTDVVMPHMSGKELAARTATLHPESQILYMSGYTDNAIVLHGVLEATASFLQKPFAPKTLLKKVREVLDSGKQNGGLKQ